VPRPAPARCRLAVKFREPLCDRIFRCLLKGNIQRGVDRYVVFYRGGYQSHSILKPIDIVAKAIITSPLDIAEDDLLWQIQGELKNWLDRVRGRQATGYAVGLRA